MLLVSHPNMEDGFVSDDGYLHLRHNKTMLMAHIIFVTKYRHKLDNADVWKTIKDLIYEMAERMHLVSRYSTS